MDHLPAPEKKDQLEAILEGELQSHLDHALTALGQDLTEVVLRVIREVTRAWNNRAVARSSDAVRTLIRELLHESPVRQHQVLVNRRPFARRTQRQEDVAIASGLVVKVL